MNFALPGSSFMNLTCLIKLTLAKLDWHVKAHNSGCFFFFFFLFSIKVVRASDEREIESQHKRKEKSIYTQ